MESLRRLNRLITVEPAMFIFYFSFQLILVAWQQTIYMKLCHRQHYNVSDCLKSSWEERHTELQDSTSHWILYTSVVTRLPLLVSIVLLSGYSDRQGLRLALALPFVGGVLSIVWAVVQIVYIDWDPTLLLPTPAVWGITGYYPVVGMACFTYIVLDPDTGNRGFRFAVVESIQTIGGAAGSFAVGPIMDAVGGSTGLICVFAVAGACQVLALADIIFRLKRLPDSNQQLEEHCSALRSCFNLETVKSYFTSVLRRRDNSKRLHLHIVIIASTVGSLAYEAMTDLIFLYLTKEYGKSNTEYSIYNGLGGVATLLGNTVLVYILTTYYKISDITFTVIGAIGCATTFTLLGYANYPVLYWLSAALKLFVSFPYIGGRLYISHTVTTTEQAAGMGYYAAIESIVGLLASVTFNALYPSTLAIWPGLCFALMGLMCVLTVPALTCVRWRDLGRATDSRS